MSAPFLLTFLAALGSGLVAGVFFAFSSFVMPALARLPAAVGIEAMQSVNVAVINRVFLGVFLGTGLLCVVLLVATPVLPATPGGRVGALAAVVYLLGSLAVTIAFNVPRNEALATLSATSPEAPRLWSQYLSEWTTWNHVRGAASLLASALFTLALLRVRLPSVSSAWALLGGLLLGGCSRNAIIPLPPPGSQTPVARLSELELFGAEPARLEPRSGVIPYDVAVSTYADGAEKRRFVVVPKGSKIHVQEGSWDLPLGTYLVKSFSFPKDARDPSLGSRLIETRFLLQTSRGLVASTYLWDDDQRDAHASAGGLEIPVRFIDLGGAPKEVLYRVPGTSQCPSCHQGRALGLRASQLNVRRAYVDGPDDQLAHLSKLGLIDRAPGPHATLVDPFGEAPIEARARSYLDAHCSFCHGAGGEAASTGLLWGVSETLPVCRPTAPFGLGPPALAPGQPGRSELLRRMQTEDTDARMPRGATHSIDQEGVRLLSLWIASMPKAPCD